MSCYNWIYPVPGNISLLLRLLFADVRRVKGRFRTKSRDGLLQLGHEGRRSNSDWCCFEQKSNYFFPSLSSIVFLFPFNPFTPFYSPFDYTTHTTVNNWHTTATRLSVSHNTTHTEPARFLTRMKSESINKKESVELECSSTGDSPIEISWSKEDKVIREAKERFLWVPSLSSFVIHQKYVVWAPNQRKNSERVLG